MTIRNPSIVVVYNGFTIPNPINKYTYTEDYDTWTFQQDFVVEDPIYIPDAMDSLNVKDAALQVDYMARNIIDFSKDDNTAYDIIGTVRKVPDGSFGLKQVYRFICKGKFLADKLAAEDADDYYKKGLLISSNECNYTSSQIHSILITGVYTATKSAVGDDNAYSNYMNDTTGAAAFADHIIKDRYSLDETYYDIITETFKDDDKDKFINFQILYRYNVNQLTVNGAIQHDFRLQRVYGIEMAFGKAKVDIPATGKMAAEGYAGTKKEVEFGSNEIPEVWRCSAKFAMHSEVYTTAKAIHGIYPSLKDFVLNKLKTIYSGSQVYVPEGSYSLNLQDWMVETEYLVYVTTTDLIRLEATTTFKLLVGDVYRKILDGKHFTYKIFAPGAEAIRAIKIEAEAVNNPVDSDVFKVFTVPDKNWKLIDVDEASTHRYRTGANDVEYQIYYKSRTYTYKYAIGDDKAPPSTTITDAYGGRNLFGL